MFLYANDVHNATDAPWISVYLGYICRHDCCLKGQRVASLHYTMTVRVLLYKFIKGRQRREMLAALFHR